MMGFALSNTDTATLRFFGIPQFEWRAPLVLFLLIFFAAGALLGALATVPIVFRQRRELNRLRRMQQTSSTESLARPAGLVRTADSPKP
jgi:hypothetical protein